MTERFRSILVLGGVVLATIYLFGEIDFGVPPYSEWDLVAYLRMAEAVPSLAEDVGLPYASRLLGPWLAGLGPISEPQMFRILTLMAAFAVPLFFFKFMVDRGLDEGSALTAAVLLVFNKQFFGFNLWNYFQVNDMLGLLLLVFLFDAMLRERWPIFGLGLFLGAVTRESTMVMVPVAAMYLWEKGRLKNGWGVLLAVSAPGLILFLGLRAFLPVTGLGALEAFRTYSVKAAAWQTWFYLFINSVAPLTFLPLVFFRRTGTFFKGRRYALLFLVLVSVSAFFGSNNERLMAPVFIVFYWLIGDILMNELGAWPRGTRGFLIACAFLASLHQTYTRFDFLTKNLVIVLSLGSLLLVGIAAILFLIWKGNRLRSGPAGD